MNQLSTDKRIRVVAALVEGMSIRATVRITGVSKPTILKLLRDLGTACADFHDRNVRGLRPERIQTNEIWAFNYCKAKNVAKAKAAPEGAGDVWTWTAIDADNKLIIAYHVGLRFQEDADRFMLDLAGRIVSRAQLTTDGHGTYLPAVENAFGLADVDYYAQLVKLYGPETAGKGAERKYSPGKVNGTKKIPQIGLPDREHVSTSYVECHNLTIRMQMRRFTRLTNAHSKQLAYHVASVAMFFMFYNYCRVHSTIDTSPAVACGLADHVWTLEELLKLAD
jgi:IS1 family transposase